MNKPVNHLPRLSIPWIVAFAFIWIFFQGVKAQNSGSAAPYVPREDNTAVVLPVDQDSAPVSNLKIVRDDLQSLVIEFQAPDFQVLSEEREDGACQTIQLSGFVNTRNPGEPQLPIGGGLIGIPPEGEPEISLLDVNEVSLPEKYVICPVPEAISNPVAEGMPTIVDYRSVKDPQVYSQNALFPANVVEVTGTGSVRSQRVASLRFNPFRYNPVTGELRYVKSLKIRVDFPDAAKTTFLPHQIPDEGPFEETLRSSILNYETARAWRVQSARVQPASDAPQNEPNRSSASSSSETAYKISVDHDGVYQISYADLLTAGLPLGQIDPRTFHVANLGNEIAIRVAGESDGVFNESDFILFYGQKATTKFTDVNVYWLTWGGSPGLRMSDRDATPIGGYDVPSAFTDSIRIEQNLVYRNSFASGPDDDHWYWTYIYKSAKQRDFNFQLDGVANAPVTATLTPLFRHYNATPQHHTLIYLNGHLIDDELWLANEFNPTIPVSQSFLITGTNTISVLAPFDGGITDDQFFINHFDLSYARPFSATNDQLDFSIGSTGQIQVDGFAASAIQVMDITTPTLPTMLTGVQIVPDLPGYRLSFDQDAAETHHYLAVTSNSILKPASIIEDNYLDLHDVSLGADYVIISNADFMVAAQTLADYRSSQGLRVKLVDLQNVYDDFGYGLVDPEAIRSFLAYAYSNWQPPAPSYVLFVGDGNFDFKNYLGTNEPVYVPPYLEDVDFYIGETAADNRYVAVAGSDILPDMNLGRLPVRTEAEAAALVNKIIQYEQNPPLEDWAQKVMFIADDPDPGAGDFPALSDLIADHELPAPYQADKIYYASPPYTSSVDALAAIVAGINDGRLIVSYVGHAAINLWASPKLFDVPAIQSLANPSRLPFMVPMTCLEGYYIYPVGSGPDHSSLAESIVRAQGKGAIASFSATGEGIATGHDKLERGLFQAIFRDYVDEIGPATTQAKYYMYAVSGGEYPDLLDTYMLFGDPATRLPVLHRILLPLIRND